MLEERIMTSDASNLYLNIFLLPEKKYCEISSCKVDKSQSSPRPGTNQY